MDLRASLAHLPTGLPGLARAVPAFDNAHAAEGTVFGNLRRAVARDDGDDGNGECRCRTEFRDAAGTADRRTTELRVESDDCPGDGDLAASPACRATVVDALADADVDAVRTRSAGVERTYDGDAAGLLVAAGRFVERARFHDESLAARARRDPLGAAREATGRAGPAADVAAETGLAEGAARADGYGDALSPYVGPTVARARVETRPPDGATLRESKTLDTGATARVYDAPEGRVYHLVPRFASLDADATATLHAAYERLAAGGVAGGDRAPGRAVRAAVNDRGRDAGDAPVETLSRVLRRHTRGHGVLDDLFSDPDVTDVFATAPVARNPLRVTVDGERLRTNVRLTAAGAATLASRFRRESGRAFSRADPTLDAVVESETGDSVRVAGVTAPASDGVGFAFRRHAADAWTLPGLVANGTLPADAAGLLSLAVRRGASVLVAGPRGAGKTTLLGALLWELPAPVRTVVIEDTPELPVAALQREGRDVQALSADPGEAGSAPTPAEALRTALRLGDGALVVGEVRGEEARTLYEAMRVGAARNAVLGTIHGDSPAAVRERVVTDLGVPDSSFSSTDLVVTLDAGESLGRRAVGVHEVRTGDGGSRFEALYRESDDDGDAPGLSAAGALARGNSRLLADLARTSESYADLRGRLDVRRETLRTLAASDRTRPADVVAAYRREADR